MNNGWLEEAGIDGDDLEKTHQEMIDRANRRFPGLARLIDDAVEALYLLLGSYDPGEAEVEGPERLQEYSGFTDEMMSNLFYEDAPEVSISDVVQSDTPEEAESKIDAAFAEGANLLKVAGDLFHWAAAMEMPLPEEGGNADD